MGHTTIKLAGYLRLPEAPGICDRMRWLHISFGIRSYLGKLFHESLFMTLEYEPEDNSFCGWLPDFAIKVRKTDTQVVWCEVKPLYFKTFPQVIADKILKAEGDHDNNLIVAILGIEVPVLVRQFTFSGMDIIEEARWKKKVASFLCWMCSFNFVSLESFSPASEREKA